MEPHWEEALDVDDSDLQSSAILRPCKQQRLHDQTNSSTFALDSSPSSSQTLNPHPQNFTPACDAKVIPPFRIIPGPSGIVQAAKLRKARDNGRLFSQEEHVATQEYIRRAVEDPEEDDDFKRNPWISAIKFVGGDGMSNCVASAPLGDIKKHLKNGKLDQVVAVVKSCAPNDLGDLMVVLKDPTGTVSGTIHHKVLTEGEFANDIFVGSVLILHKVSVFSPSRAAHYLNITMRNLVKVFYKDIGPSRNKTFHGRTMKDAAPAAGGLGSLKYASNLVDNGNKGTDPVQVHVEVEQETVFYKDNEPSRKDTFQEPAGNGGAPGSHMASENDRKRPIEGENLLGSLKYASNLVHNRNNTNPVEVLVEPATVSASLPSWTDEQLNELFDDDYRF